MNTIEKHMDLFTMEDMGKLIGTQQAPCISIYMPTFQQMPEAQQNPIRFKNMVSKVEELLADSGMETEKTEALLAPLHQLVESSSIDYWNHMSDGLAMFLSPEMNLTYREPHTFDEHVYVSDVFNVRPLLPLIQNNGVFYVLELNQENVRLLACDKLQIGEVELEDVPQSLEEALKFDEFERSIQHHATSSGRTPGGQDAMFHGHGTGTDDALRKENILRFFRALDNGICDYLNDGSNPLILAGVDSLRGLYRQANHYNNLMDEGIDNAPQSLSDAELHERAWKIIKPHYQQEFVNSLDQFYQLDGNNDERAVGDIQEIVPAAYFQRVDTLFVPQSHTHWGTFDEPNNSVTLHEQPESDSDDLLNQSIIHTLANGGAVYLIEDDEEDSEQDDETHAFAILRY